MGNVLVGLAGRYYLLWLNCGIELHDELYEDLDCYVYTTSTQKPRSRWKSMVGRYARICILMTPRVWKPGNNKEMDCGIADSKH